MPMLHPSHSSSHQPQARPLGQSESEAPPPCPSPWARAVATTAGDRRRELQAFDDTKAGVKGLLDAGTKFIPAIFHHPPDSLPHQEADASSATDDAAAAAATCRPSPTTTMQKQPALIIATFWGT